MNSTSKNIVALLIVFMLIGCSKEPANPSVKEEAAISNSSSSEFSADEPEEPELMVLPNLDKGAEKTLLTASIEGYAESTRIIRIYLNPSKCAIYSPDEIVLDGKEPFDLKNGAKFMIVANECLTSDVKEIIVETSKGSFSTPVVLQ